jgi:hypothetical protein
MASESGDRGGLLSAGGILSIIVGAGEIIGGAAVATLLLLGLPLWQPEFPFAPRLGGGFPFGSNMTIVVIVAIVVAVLGIVAIVGGVSAVRRGSYGLSLVGAICALIPINILGLLAVIFVALGRGEFGEEEY